MDSSLRNTQALLARINKLRDELIQHFETLVGRASGNMSGQSRASTAMLEYQMKVETGAIIRAAEDLQVLIRQLQEMWLFGQLNTLKHDEAQDEVNEKAKVVAALLRKMVGENDGSAPGDVVKNGHANNTDGQPDVSVVMEDT